MLGPATRCCLLPAVRRSAFAQPGLEGLRIAAYAPAEPGVPSSPRRLPVAVGRVVAQLSPLVFAVDFRDSPPPPAVSLGSRVYVAYEREGATPLPQQDGGAVDDAPGRGFLMCGFVVRVNLNGTFGVLLENNRVDLGVPPERIAVTEGVCKFVRHPGYLQVAEWVRTAGLSGADEAEGTACMLYHCGWRAERLHLLEASDTHLLAHLSQRSRMSLMEKAEWQRDHYREMRSLYSERVKERDRRYMAAKYAGILSASVAFCGAFSLFGWNYRNHLTHQRSYQMRFAVRTLCKEAPPGASTTADAAHQLSRQTRREALERWIRPVFQQLDTAHPRIVVITGSFRCGKSSLCRAAMRGEGMAVVVVDVRVREDPLRSVIKALGVPHVEACGDALDFVSEACCRAKSMMGGKTPVAALWLRGSAACATSWWWCTLGRSPRQALLTGGARGYMRW